MFAVNMVYNPIVRELVDYLHENQDVRAQFQLSFDLAVALPLDVFEKYCIRTLEDYFDYMDKYVHWVPSEDTTGTNVYYHICVFYFILDMFPVFQQQDPIIPSTGPPYQWLTQWLIKYAVEMGTWMDTTDSITPYSIQSFRNAPDYHMEDYEEPTGGWKTFNEFFARHLKKGKRPIAPDTEDYLAITSPADCSYNGQWVIDENANITTFTVKGLPWSISELLKDGNTYSPRLAGGIFTVYSRLHTTFGDDGILACTMLSIISSIDSVDRARYMPTSLERWRRQRCQLDTALRE